MKKSEKIISAVLTMALGVLLIALKGKFIGILMTIAGVFLIALGVVDIVHKFVPPAVIKIVVGGLIILCGWVLVEAVLYIVAAVLLIAGVLLLYDKIKNRIRCTTLVHTICEYAVPALFIIIGIMFLFHQSEAINIVFILSGCLTVLEGGVLLANAIMDDY